MFWQLGWLTRNWQDVHRWFGCRARGPLVNKLGWEWHKLRQTLPRHYSVLNYTVYTVLNYTLQPFSYTLYFCLLYFADLSPILSLFTVLAKSLTLNCLTQPCWSRVKCAILLAAAWCFVGSFVGTNLIHDTLTQQPPQIL